MTTTTPAPDARDTAALTPSAGSRILLACGVVAGPLYLVVAAVQAVTREGFDLRRHAVSLLSNGDLGWVQIANFVVTGLLVVVAAVAMRRVLNAGPGRTWGPVLVGLYGVGVVASGVLVADPADGFPIGTPPGVPEQVSWHGALHFVAGGVAFLSLVAACLVFGRRFARLGRPGWARYSLVTGVGFLAVWSALVASGGTSPAVNLAFAVAVAAGWVWVSALAARLRADSMGP